MLAKLTFVSWLRSGASETGGADGPASHQPRQVPNKDGKGTYSSESSKMEESIPSTTALLRLMPSPGVAPDDIEWNAAMAW